jgi:hypothetical protein
VSYIAQMLLPVQQIPSMKEFYPQFSYSIRRGVVIWNGFLTPTDASRTYLVRITHRTLFWTESENSMGSWKLTPGANSTCGILFLVKDFATFWRRLEIRSRTVQRYTSSTPGRPAAP